MIDDSLLLEVQGIHKSYAAPVLIDVNFQLRPGEVHALMGANGAGKSTLARIICGLTHGDRGSMWLRGRPYQPHTKALAEREGVHIVQQELNLIPNLTVAENLYLNRLPSWAGCVRYGHLNDLAEQALAHVGLDDIDPRIPVAQLGVGQQQLVEIAAALSRQCHVLILDEPTAALTDPQIDLLFKHIRHLQQSGVGILYISHRMEEIRQITDRTTVMRDGRIVATESSADLQLDEVVRLMVGRDVEHEARHRERKIGDVALRVRELTRGESVREVSFEVRRGEIFGIAGLVGSGRTELLRAMFGADAAESGWVQILPHGKPCRFRQPRDAVAAGLAMIPEDRKQHGLMLPLSVSLNVTLGKLAEMFRPLGWIRRVSEQDAASRYNQLVNTHYDSLDQPVEQLSGGNQQKVVMARWLMRDAKVMLFDEPTRGIDVGAKATVYHLLGELADQHKALVVVSSDLDELLAICDRIGVMSAGRMVALFPRGQWSKEEITAAAFPTTDAHRP
jgi:ribose transport system ATP-binding protein